MAPCGPVDRPHTLLRQPGWCKTLFDARPIARPLPCLAASFALIFTVALASPSSAADATETALVGPGSLDVRGMVEVPGVLSVADTDRYRRIFALQQDGEWDAASHVMEEVTNPILLGHTQAQKYLHPTAYRSKFRELRDWLSVNADHPQARRIYTLAVRRMPGGTKRPDTAIVTNYYSPLSAQSVSPVEGLDLSRSQRRRATQIRSEIDSRLRRGWPTGALSVINQKQTRELLSPTEIDDARSDIARAYFRAGKDAEALAVADAAADNTGLVPIAHWWGGLAAWRLGHITDAQRHFSALAKSTTASDWNVAAGAYWAARSFLVGREPQQVNQWLAIGAALPFTFYGVLSRRALALDLDYDWTLPHLDRARLHEITTTPQGARAVALLQVGRYVEADAELRSLAGAEPDLIPAITALAARTDTPSIAHRLTKTNTEQPLAAAMFPLPPWAPSDGFQADRALIFGFMRQESAFEVRARSPVGARGLMQLMPRTASFIGRQRALSGSKKYVLFEPEFNMALGQRYLNFLLEDDVVDGDIFRLAVAYNAGPGNLRRWMRAVDYQDDPLLFIESLPTRETRIFVERVLMNFWIYRDQLGQPTPTLDAVVAGRWPGYAPLDGTQTAARPAAN